MILSDNDIAKHLSVSSLVISPIQENQIQPASVDLRLDRYLLDEDGEKIDIFDESYMLQPGEFLLGSTIEYVEIPDFLVGRVDGRSSIGRLGVMVHITAGYIDPGFCGNITLEICNISKKPFELKYDSRICQLVLNLLTEPCHRPYGTDGLGSKYHCSDGVVASKWEDL